MNKILFFLLEVILTFSISTLVFHYFRPFLIRILIDLCGSEERLQIAIAHAMIAIR